MEKIGRQIVAEKPELHSDSIKNSMLKQIDSRIKNLNEDERDAIFYCSVYDYWVYGTLIYESINFDFAHKTHEEKSEYITKKNFFPYYFHLNDKDKARKLLANKYNAYKFFEDYYQRDIIFVDNENDYETFKNFADEHSEFVVKPAEFDSGRGIHKENLSDYESVRSLFEKLLEEKNSIAQNSAEKDFLQTKYGFGLVPEEIIQQVPEMATPHPNSLNLIRITTVRGGVSLNGVKILYSSFKVGDDGNFLNNPTVGSFLAMINPET